MTASICLLTISLFTALPLPQASDEYRLADAMIDMAEVLIRGRDMLNEAAESAGKKESAVERDLDTLLGYERAIARFREARDPIAIFKVSQNETIRSWAGVANDLCSALEDAFRESLRLTTAAIQTEDERSLRALVPKIAANTGQVDEIWRTFPKLMALAGHIVHDGERTDSAGKFSFLRISTDEKKLLLRRLDAMKLEADQEGNRLAVEAGLSIFRDFLRRPWNQ